jgi:aromatic-L-amino-acid decarboxylase
LFAPHPFSLVCFSHVEGDDATKRLATALNASGKVAVTPSVISDRSFIRVSIGQTHTDEVHLQQLQALISELA